MPVTVPWGDQVLDISFAGMQFHFEGLSVAQVRPLVERFDLGFPTSKTASQAMRIRVGQMAFDDDDPMRYRGRDDNYTPVVKRLGDNSLWMEGMGLRGALRLDDPVAGELYTAGEAELVDPMVVENYLRFVTAYVALRQGGVLFHSAGVVVDDRAWLFIGRSNAGKTTISRLALAAGCEVLSDDANLLLPGGVGEFRAGPVPFAGELGQTACRSRKTYSVAGIFWLGKAHRVAVRDLSPAMAYSRMLVCCPTVNVDDQQSRLLDEVIRALMDSVPVRHLDFSRERPFTDVIAQLRPDPLPSILVEGEEIGMRVTGDCMAPLLCHGQDLRVRKQAHYRPGDVLVFSDADGRRLVHRFLGTVPGRAGERAMTRADKARNIDVLVPRERILGRVVACDSRSFKVPLWRRLQSVFLYGWWLVRLSIRRAFQLISTA